MQTYELTYIIPSNMAVEGAETAKKDFEAFLQGKGGLIVKSERTAPQPLAYQIKKQSSGFFVVTEFQIEESKVKEVKAELEKNVNVLRSFLIVKKPKKIMKERRTRKPLMAVAADTVKESVFKKAKKEELSGKELDKKLDEILSE